MKTLIFAITFLSIMDLVATPFLLVHIRKTGEFQYLVSTLHKFIFLALVLTSGLTTVRNDSQGMLFQIVFCGAFLFLLNLTFELNVYFNRRMDATKYNLQNMTEDGKKMMLNVMDNMKEQDRKPFTQKFVEMFNNFATNFSQDLAVVYMVLTNDEEIKASHREIHQIMGLDTGFSKMTMKQLFFMVKNRVLVDSCALVFAAAVLMVA